LDLHTEPVNNYICGYILIEVSYSI